MKLIRNEFTKIGIKKQITSFIILTIILTLNYFINNKNLNEDNLLTMIPFIGIIITILFSGIMSNEIENGTFRFYLTKPVNRYKIYLSKLLTIIIFIMEMLIYTILFCFLINKNINNVNNFLITSTSLILISTIIIFLSTIIKNQSITSSIPILFLTFGLTITELLLKKNITIIKYTFIPYLDLTMFKTGVIDIINEEYNVALSLNEGIIIIIIYSIIFIFLGIKIFKKKNI